jgi:hypothetical protein
MMERDDEASLLDGARTTGREAELAVETPVP